MESELKAREKERREQMEALCDHMEKCVKMVDESHRSPRGKSALELSVKLVPYQKKKDDIENHLLCQSKEYKC